MKLVPAKMRDQAVVWTVNRLGIPDGFQSLVDYTEYVNELMDRAEYNECWLMNDQGGHEAYFAWCLSEDIHHKGTIFDVTNVVIRPDSKCANKLWREVRGLAQAEDCQWISRCVHEADGSIRNLFKRV